MRFVIVGGGYSRAPFYTYDLSVGVYLYTYTYTYTILDLPNFTLARCPQSKARQILLTVVGMYLGIGICDFAIYNPF